ncbi:MAG: paraquat-inducible protein A [bacterium]|nr:paraquat-inducible protein A [Gemmatimonadota bacterium]
MKVRNAIGLALLVASFAALWPGITKPLITITAKISLFGTEREVFRETRSILQTVESLHDSGNDLVAGLIFLFGVVVPIVKGVLLGVALSLRAALPRRYIANFARGISKWAMNDVFVVAVYVAFLSAKATDQLDANLEVGFYWFVSYVLLSLVSLQFLRLTPDWGTSDEESIERSTTSGR